MGKKCGFANDQNSGFGQNEKGSTGNDPLFTSSGIGGPYEALETKESEIFRQVSDGELDPKCIHPRLSASNRS